MASENLHHPSVLTFPPEIPSSEPQTRFSLLGPTRFARLTFAEAERAFVDYKRAHLKAATVECYEMYGRNLRVLFGGKRLQAITIDDIKEYQRLRTEGRIVASARPRGSKRGSIATGRAGSSLINHEVNMLSQMLDKAGLWAPLSQWYTPLRQRDPDPPKTMTADQEKRFFAVAALNPDWTLAHLVSALTNDTGAAGCEIRFLRLMDVDLQSIPPRFRTPAGKNAERKWREIVLNDTAYSVMCRIIERALQLGACEPQHFVFPFRVKTNCYDVTRPASKSWIKKQWNALRIAAGVPWLKPHNLRFQCATRARARGIPGEIIKKQLGWRNLKMLEHYNRPQIDLLYQAMQLIDSNNPKKETGIYGKPWMPRFAQSEFNG